MRTVASRIRIRRVTVRFGGVRALDMVNVDFPAQGVVALVGPNGAGKTTLLNVLTGYRKPDEGVCEYDGVVLRSSSPHEVARLGIVRSFQDLRLPLLMTPAELLQLARACGAADRLWPSIWTYSGRVGRARERHQALDLLHQLGLEDRSNAPIGSLSYGQRKLVGVACCLAADGHVVALDEPVAGTDLDARERVIQSIRRLAEAGRLVLFIEHDLEAVREIADVVVVMSSGHIVAHGPCDTILDSPSLAAAYHG